MINAKDAKGRRQVPQSRACEENCLLRTFAVRFMRLFNIIAPRIGGVRFLDLCAGSGAVGIEAVSRGAVHVTFVDSSRKMCTLIKANLELCGIERNESQVIEAEAQDYLRRFVAKQPDSGKPRDIIFFDPGDNSREDHRWQISRSKN